MTDQFIKLPRRIFLTGMMGSGKTTTGKLLAEKLNYAFIDSDQRIEQKYGPIPEIFRDRGEAVFRQFETEILEEIVRLDNTVVSSGGGMPCFSQNSQMMREHGLVVYLECTGEILVDRLKRAPGSRPLIATGRLDESIQELLHVRRECYEQAHVRVNANESPTSVVAQILERIRPDKG
jgi:shikimate kinase